MNTDVIQPETVGEPVIKGMEITPCSNTKEGKGWDLQIIGGNKWQIENYMFTYNIGPTYLHIILLKLPLRCNLLAVFSSLQTWQCKILEHS